MKTYKSLTKDDYLQICLDFAKTKNGKCLSIEYDSCHTKLLWECEFGHTWYAISSNVKRGKWCPHCSNNAKLSLKNCIELADSRQGKCLSEKYINAATPLTWQCQYGHIWNANFNNVKSKNSWCPKCSDNISEKVCRLFFEQAFCVPFTKNKPSWLIGINGFPLELDGFNQSLNLAFEHHGNQHYLINGFFTRNQDDLDKRIAADSLKRNLCLKHGVTLIEIKQLPNLSNIAQVTDTLYDIIIKNGFNITKPILNITNLYSSKIDKYKKLASDKDGVCLSDVYIDYYTKLVWQCKLGHIWSAIGYSIERGHWCSKCAGNK